MTIHKGWQLKKSKAKKKLCKFVSISNRFRPDFLIIFQHPQNEILHLHLSRSDVFVRVFEYMLDVQSCVRIHTNWYVYCSIRITTPHTQSRCRRLMHRFRRRRRRHHRFESFARLLHPHTPTRRFSAVAVAAAASASFRAPFARQCFSRVYTVARVGL